MFKISQWCRISLQGCRSDRLPFTAEFSTMNGCPRCRRPLHQPTTRNRILLEVHFLILSWGNALLHLPPGIVYCLFSNWHTVIFYSFVRNRRILSILLWLLTVLPQSYQTRSDWITLKFTLQTMNPFCVDWFFRLRSNDLHRFCFKHEGEFS